MKKILATMLLLSGICLAEGMGVANRTNQAFRFDSSSTNVPTSPSTASTSSIVMSAIANGQHLKICHESTSRVRVNWTHGSTSSAPSSSAYNDIIPAAASGSFVCSNYDDIQLSGTVYIWSDGSAISSGLFYGSTW